MVRYYELGGLVDLALKNTISEVKLTSAVATVSETPKQDPYMRDNGIMIYRHMTKNTSFNVHVVSKIKVLFELIWILEGFYD